jgi:hypothetical protein
MFLKPSPTRPCDRSSATGLLRSLAVGAGIATLALGGQAIAADQITLRYEGTVRTVPVENFRNFVESGEAADPDIQAFFEEHPTLREIVQDVLTAEIIIPPSVSDRLQTSSIGQFILIQLNKLLTTPIADNEADNLRTALVASYENDNRFSLLEVIESYPESDVVLDLDGLRPIYDDVKTFVERIQPALEVAREFLQDLVCDCETTATSGDSASDAVPSAAAGTATASTCATSPDETALMAVMEQLLLGNLDAETLDATHLDTAE